MHIVDLEVVQVAKPRQKRDPAVAAHADEPTEVGTTAVYVAHARAHTHTRNHTCLHHTVCPLLPLLLPPVLAVPSFPALPSPSVITISMLYI